MVTRVATSPNLNGPESVAVDSNGIVYVTDSGNHVIRTISLLGFPKCFILFTFSNFD